MEAGLVTDGLRNNLSVLPALNVETVNRKAYIYGDQQDQQGERGPAASRQAGIVGGMLAGMIAGHSGGIHYTLIPRPTPTYLFLDISEIGG